MHKFCLAALILLFNSSAFCSGLCLDLFTARSVGNEIQIGSEFVQDDSVEIPVFTDIHGNVEGLFRAIGDLQVRRGRVFPVVFVTGDLGFFPDPSNLNEETHQKELSRAYERKLSQYYASSNMYEAFFQKARGLRRLQAKIYFVRGNHEDQRLLEEITQVAPREIIEVDRHGVLHYLTDGSLFSVRVPGAKPFQVAAVGGIHKMSRESAYRKDHRIAFNDVSLNSLLGDLGSTEEQHLDLLLTHQGIWQFNGGHIEVNSLIEIAQPTLHFSGHGHLCDGPLRVGDCMSYQVGALDQDRPDATDGSALLLNLKTDGTYRVFHELRDLVK